MEVDTELKMEELQPPDMCRCCLQYGELKELWSEYAVDAGVIIYGEALVECFSLALHQPEDAVEKICVTCISKLQDANAFKKLVVESDKKLLQQYFQGEELKMDDKEYSQEYQQSVSDDNDSSEKERSDDDVSSDEEKILDTEYLELELLEAAGSNEPINTKAPGPKRSKKNVYKQYAPENLEKCVRAVQLDLMTANEAARFYNVPFKTIDGRLRGEKSDTTVTKNDIKRENYKKFLQEIKTILKYTNATPYKSKTGQYSCAYCQKHIEDPVALRAHTKTVHAGERFSGVDVFMKANWINETIKIDIVDLCCIICPTRISSWNDMFQHLKQKHNEELDEAYTKVIPYKLTDPLMCALCDDRCDSYPILDAHMNSHYTNYICGECGDTYLSESRLKKHIETHSTERYNCPFCPKSFTLDKYRKKHVDGVHRQGLIFRCRYCGEEFTNELRRHQHMEKNHSDKIKTISCEYCTKTFTYRPYYMKHLRLSHRRKDVKPHKCTRCDKVFSARYELKKHEDWHLGYNKQTCLVCHKTFSSKQYLEKHYEKAHDETEVLVLETDQS